MLRALAIHLLTHYLLAAKRSGESIGFDTTSEDTFMKTKLEVFDTYLR